MLSSRIRESIRLQWRAAPAKAGNNVNKAAQGGRLQGGFLGNKPIGDAMPMVAASFSKAGVYPRGIIILTEQKRIEIQGLILVEYWAATSHEEHLKRGCSNDRG